MWTSYFIAIAVGIAVLYVPGYFAMRSLRFSRLLSVIAAPIAGVFAYATLPILYYEVGISCDALTILVPTVVVSLLAFFISRPFAKPQKPTLVLPEYEPVSIGKASVPFIPLALLGTIAVAVFMTYFVFVSNLPTPEAFYSRYDNQTHLNMVQSFIDSGRWTMLHASNFAASPEYATAATSTMGSFYPSGWHCLVALVCILAGAKVTVASNALITLMCALVFPTGMFAFMCALFPTNKQVVAAGAIVMSMFATWPWVFIIKGPCLPNLMGLSMMVAALAIVVLYVDEKLVRKKLLSFVLFSIVALAALAYAHPNTVFTAFIFLAAYGGHVIDRAIREAEPLQDKNALRAFLRCIALLAYAAVLVAAWYAAYQLPFLDSVLTYTWSEHTSLIRSIGSLGVLSMVISGVQAGMMVLCLVGLIRCLRERMWWVLLPMLFFALCFVVSKSGIDPIKYWIASLWYQTPYRFTALVSIFLIPIASMGLDSCCRWADGAIARRRGLDTDAESSNHIGTVIVLVVFLAITFLPPFHAPINGKLLHPGLSYTEYRIDEIYRADKEHVYSTEEVAFVYEAMELIPEGALVINQPNDGSTFAYGVNHLNTYFRHGRAGKKNDDAKVIMASLDEYTTNKDAKEAIETTGAHYLLQLDQGVAYEDGVWLNQYKENSVKNWVGIDGVRDNTPGFKVLLSEGDMRLYEITDVA